ncbi:hypothetical protein [Tengunoibacter tsumagoiensis]|uniref:Uncharacterized protein n=1 Tax=Tengunoibacter tsumagoiensis TaxID=2014871 RepID=A0A402A8S4_9CHLR|nr:hypothetical protein [Tengunoibacter tsumagoiensis]GCE15567.1 hypothetical protein KTT_54260 [Tengunoibacter tsumagoiensis]
MSLPHTSSALAFVEDAHNQGALVCLLGETQVQPAHYDLQLQNGGVVICVDNIVVLERSRTPWAITWRVGISGTVRACDGQLVTLAIGHREMTLPLTESRSYHFNERWESRSSRAIRNFTRNFRGNASAMVWK